MCTLENNPLYGTHFFVNLYTAPPPVNENFTMTCASQKMRSRHITCASDGSFDPVQCMGKKCHCVNTQTGEVLRPVDHKTRNCSEGVTQ